MFFPPLLSFLLFLTVLPLILTSDAGCYGLWASLGLFCQSRHLWILFRSKSGSWGVEWVSNMHVMYVYQCVFDSVVCEQWFSLHSASRKDRQAKTQSGSSISKQTGPFSVVNQSYANHPSLSISPFLLFAPLFIPRWMML